MAPIPNRANNELVVPAWIASIPELASAGVGVATTLPRTTTWATAGFVVVNVITDPDDHYLPEGHPVVQLDIYATAGGKPAWNVVSNIESAIRAATLDLPTIQRELTLSSNGKSYGAARVLSCYRLIGPRRHHTDPAQYARIMADYQFHWVAIEEGS